MALSFFTNPTLNQSLKHFSDEAIASYIYNSHHEDDKIKIDLHNYILLIDSIITIADRIAVTITTQDNKGRLIFSNDFLNVNVVDPPVFILHQISSQLASKGAGIEKAHKTTLNILDTLSNYPWEAKAVLTFTAFASDYGHIWHINHYSLLDPLAKSLSMIKGVPLLKTHLNSIKYQQVLLRPNSLIYCCLRAIKLINRLKNLADYEDVEDVSAFPSALVRQIPLLSYWIIHIIVAARVEISSYLNETEGQPQQYLNELSEKIDSIINMLQSYLNITEEQQSQFSVISKISL